MTTKKTKSSIPQDQLDCYDKLVETNPKIERKGATMPYTSYNGNMFSYLGKDGSLGLRLPTEARADFLKKHKTTLIIANGIVMKEYVLVPDKLLKNTPALKPYFDQSFEYVKSLKSK